MGYAQKVVVKLETLRFYTRFFHTARRKATMKQNKKLNTAIKIISHVLVVYGYKK